MEEHYYAYGSDKQILGTVAIPIKFTPLPPTMECQDVTHLSREPSVFDDCETPGDIVAKFGRNPRLLDVANVLRESTWVNWRWDEERQCRFRVRTGPNRKVFPMKILDTEKISAAAYLKIILLADRLRNDRRYGVASQFFLGHDCDTGVLGITITYSPSVFSNPDYAFLNNPHYQPHPDFYNHYFLDLTPIWFALARQGCTFQGNMDAFVDHMRLYHTAVLKTCTSERTNVADMRNLLRLAKKERMPEAPPPPGLTVACKPFQLQSIQWMLDRERLGLEHFFWTPVTTIAGTKLMFSAPLRRMVLQTADEASKNVFGGFLCEEMGMGKTVITLGVILSNPAPLPGHVVEDADTLNVTPLKSAATTTTATAGGFVPAKQVVVNAGRVRSRGTLVVCPVSLVGQWMKEIESKVDPLAVRVYAYHGQSRNRLASFLAQFDIVVTTYSTIAADFSAQTTRKRSTANASNGSNKKQKTGSSSAANTGNDGDGDNDDDNIGLEGASPASAPPKLQRLKSDAAKAKRDEEKHAFDVLLASHRVGCNGVHWHRIVLDEGHSIRNLTTLSTKVVLDIKADIKWCVTGTPVCTTPDDLVAQVCVRVF